MRFSAILPALVGCSFADGVKPGEHNFLRNDGLLGKLRKGKKGKGKSKGNGKSHMKPAIPDFSEMYVFGDSTCDVGNLKFAFNPLLPARWSDGPLFPEYIAARLGIELTPSQHFKPAYGSVPIPISNVEGNNFCVAGARSTPLSFLPRATESDGPTVRTTVQVDALLANKTGVVPSDALYVISSGINDVIDAYRNVTRGENTEEEMLDHLLFVASSLADKLKDLIKAGARYIFLVIPGNFGSLPRITLIGDKAYEKLAKRLSKVFTQYLKDAVSDVECHTGLDIAEYENFNFVDSKQVEKAHLQTEEPCFIGPASGIPEVDPPIEQPPTFEVYDKCIPSDLSGYAFFDQFHLSTASHKLFAKGLWKFMKSQFKEKDYPKLKRKSRKNKCKKPSKVSKGSKGSKGPKTLKGGKSMYRDTWDNLLGSPFLRTS